MTAGAWTFVTRPPTQWRVLSNSFFYVDYSKGSIFLAMRISPVFYELLLIQRDASIITKISTIILILGHFPLIIYYKYIRRRYMTIHLLNIVN
jgi:hypothetical protein